MLVFPLVTLAAAPVAEARQVWQMLDYVGADYAGTVSAGQISDAGEYAEMQEFSRTIRTKLAELTPAPGQEQRLALADRLVIQIDQRAPPGQVSATIKALSAQLLSAYPIETAPSKAPDLARGAQLYAQQCSACHGPAGAGDGPAAAGLDPKPIAFTDRERAVQRTPLSYYQVISQGITNTAMPSFGTLADDDRWALAFYVAGMSFDASDRTRGETLWATPAARAAIPSLEALAQASEADLSTRLGAGTARAITAFLRAQPGMAGKTTTATEGDRPLALARRRVAEAVAAYGSGDRAAAGRIALSAYLDGVEPVEPTLAARAPGLLREVETAMGEFRGMIAAGASASDIKAQRSRIEAIFDRSEAVLVARDGNAATAFVGSMMILLREGLEALLIVVGMLAFLRKADRRDTLRYVHAGWIAALLLGVVTWAAATYLVSISGAGREVTEGLSSLFAAIVLLSVGIWMHRKSVAGRWQQYLQARMSGALTGRTAVFLFLLSFISVYREVFETILFYAAMWNEQDKGAILAGFAVGTLSLGLVAFVLLRLGARLPIGKFFSWSSSLIAVLAVVLVGKGIAALQEAGWISRTAAAGPQIDWLGVYPTWETLLGQLVMAVVVLAAFYWNARPPVARTG